MDLVPGDLFDGRYRIVARLGLGALGVVYRAHDVAGEAAAADVCVKVLHREAVKAGLGEGLRLGFALLARLHHPNLVAVRGHGQAYGVPYLVSELVDGPRLDRALVGRPLADLLPLAGGVARALAHLHGNGHVHQDVKPSNVLVAHASGDDVRTWVPRLTDLAVSHLPGRGARTGTLEYLSPERLRGGPAGPRADLWALGVTLFVCATGRFPVDARRPDELLRRIEAGQIPALREVRPDAPAELERLVGWLLALDPRARPVDGRDCLAALERTVDLGEAAEVGHTEPAALVGRDPAIGRVMVALAPRPSPGPRAVLVAGPAGSGRTRFLDEIAIRAQLTGGRAARLPTGDGLAPWRQLALALGDEPADDEAAAELLDRLAAAIVRTPTVVAVDDLDRRDRLARELVARLASSLAGRPCGGRAGLVVAVGASPGPVDPAVALAVALVPLDLPAMHALTASVLADEPPPALAGLLLRDSGGSPARAVHALELLRGVGALRRLGGAWDLDDDAAEILGADRSSDRRLRGLSAAAHEALGALALFGAGAQVPLVVLHQVLERDEDATMAAIQEACAAQLVRVGAEPDGEGLVLEHRAEQVRVGCAEAIAPAARARLHTRALAALRGHGVHDPLVLGPHAIGGGLVDDARVLARAAARIAAARRDPLQTLAAADLAMAAAQGDVVARRAAQVVRARALLELGRIAEAQAEAQAVAEEAPDSLTAALIATRAAVAFGDAGLAEASLDRLEALLAGGHPVDPAELAVVRVEGARLTRGPRAALHRGDELAAAAAAGDERSRLALHVALGQAAIAVVDHPRARTELDAALALATALDDPAGLVDAHGWLAALADMAGDGVTAAAHVERGLAQAARTPASVGVARLLNLRGILCIWRGRLDDAAEALGEAERRARVAHGGRLVSSIAGNLVVVHRRRGLYGQALAASRRSLGQKRRLGDRAGLIAAHVNLADVHAELGELDLALAAVRRGEADSRALGHTRAWAQARLARAAVELARGAPTAALAALAEAEPLLDERDLVDVGLHRGAALLALGAHAQARAALDRAVEQTRASGQLDEEARACLLRARLDGADAYDDLRCAGETAERAGARAVAWLAHAATGARYLRHGLTDDAARALGRASELLAPVLADLPPRLRERYRGHPGHAGLVAAVEAATGGATGP